MEEGWAMTIERPAEIDGWVSMKHVLVGPNIDKNWAADNCTWCFKVSGLEILYIEFFFADTLLIHIDV
jgi:hypothetical protein